MQNIPCQVCEGYGMYQFEQSDTELLPDRFGLLTKYPSIEKNPFILTTMYGLAMVMFGKNKYHEAEPLFRQVTKSQKRALGIEHPDTLESMDNLTHVLLNQGKYEEAESSLRELIELQKRVLGRSIL